MTAHSSFPELSLINKLSGDASLMGYEIVDLAGFLDLVDSQAQAQRVALGELGRAADSVQTANKAANQAAQDLAASVTRTHDDVHASVDVMRDMGQNTRDVAAWVQDLGGRTASVSDTLMAVKKNNSQIDAIAMQVNTLAINAKIEAARAGEAGRGFAVVAEAINELSRQTKNAAQQISTNIEDLTSWITRLSDETKTVSAQATSVLTSADAADEALGRIQRAVADTQAEANRINTQTDAVARAMLVFEPCRTQLTQAVTTTSAGISEAHTRIERLIDTSEALVQTSAALGGTSDDAPFIEYAKSCGQALSDALTQALETGQIQDAALFSRSYSPIPGTNPEQKMAPFTDLFDRILPPIQEPALDFDPRVVFCAAVDQNGYLPTHNRKFSHPQGDDPVWNTAHCRNRRIFDDRVGLKAGRNTEPFLLQVYRRDMGGGVFKMMKDLSVPIIVNGRHWGGMRLAYTF